MQYEVRYTDFIYLRHALLNDVRANAGMQKFIIKWKLYWKCLFAHSPTLPIKTKGTLTHESCNSNALKSTISPQI